MAAKRSYPTPKVRGSGREYQPAMAQELPRGATLPLRSGGRVGAAKRSYPVSEDGATAGRSYPTPLHPKPRAAGRRSNPTSKEPWLRGRRRA